ncbi:MIP18 family protein galla-2-like [Condylostylus longicornis]|uniref:MIP18 family protein galla-2-like n=1 Tax=Condylostylus longicornis TaxID=2530218 RepID=UPI00244E063C|nr:MIP18 family protein galla-2-like [Condylostylus longicornis]
MPIELFKMSKNLFKSGSVDKAAEYFSNVTDLYDEREIFDIIRNINDPERPQTLEELNVVQQELISLDSKQNLVKIQFTPTIPHCNLATLIGLSIRVKLLRSLPPNIKVEVGITPGTHDTEDAVNKQLADKERVAAALENNHLIDVINQCIDNNRD